MSRKNFRLDRSEIVFSRSSPLWFGFPEDVWLLLSILVSFLCWWWRCHRVWKTRQAGL